MKSRLLLPSLFVAVCVAILLGLGTWQVYRLHWKEKILAQIDASEHAPPQPLGEHPPPYGRVSATGHFRYDRAVRYGIDVRDTLKGAILGHYELVPLERDGAPTVLVNRGWVPEQPTVPVDQPDGTVTVTGFVRPASPAGWFTPADNVAARQFYALDPQVIAAAIGLGPVLPFSLTVLGPDVPGHLPIPAQDFPRPPNNHLSYAVTWYSLALILLVMFVMRVRMKPGSLTAYR